MKNKYLYIETFGCQMNVHDSEQMAVILKDIGYKLTDDSLKADLILINTCSIREKAEQKAFSELGRFLKLKDENPNLMPLFNRTKRRSPRSIFHQKFILSISSRHLRKDRFVLLSPSCRDAIIIAPIVLCRICAGRR